MEIRLCPICRNPINGRCRDFENALIRMREAFTNALEEPQSGKGDRGEREDDIGFPEEEDISQRNHKMTENTVVCISEAQNNQDKNEENDNGNDEDSQLYENIEFHNEELDLNEASETHSSDDDNEVVTVPHWSEHQQNQVIHNRVDNIPVNSEQNSQVPIAIYEETEQTALNTDSIAQKDDVRIKIKCDNWEYWYWSVASSFLVALIVLLHYYT